MLAVVCGLIQPLVVVDLVDAGATTEHVRALARIPVHEQIVPPPAEFSWLSPSLLRLVFLRPCRPLHRCRGVASPHPLVYGPPCADVHESAPPRAIPGASTKGYLVLAGIGHQPPPPRSRRAGRYGNLHSRHPQWPAAVPKRERLKPWARWCTTARKSCSLPQSVFREMAPLVAPLVE